MKKYTSQISTVRHIMLEQSGGVVPTTRKREGGDVTPVEKKKKVEKTETVTKESFESRVDRIRNIIGEGSMGIERLKRQQQGGVQHSDAKVKYKVAQALAHETNPDRYQDNMDNRARTAQHMADQTDAARDLETRKSSTKLQPSDKDYYGSRVTDARNLKSTPGGRTEYYKPTGEKVQPPNPAKDYINSLGAVHVDDGAGKFSAHPEHKKLADVRMGSTVPGAAHSGAHVMSGDESGSVHHGVHLTFDVDGNPHTRESHTVMATPETLGKIRNGIQAGSYNDTRLRMTTLPNPGVMDQFRGNNPEPRNVMRDLFPSHYR